MQARRAAGLVGAVLMFAGGPHAQVPAAPADPPILSTVPTPQPGADTTPHPMSGSPIQVGDLPPGVLAVRVVRQRFANNVAGQVVELIATSSGLVTTATTGDDGRALFPALTVGDTVQASTMLDGERLETQLITMPALAGVRVMLVGGVGAAAGPASSVDASPASPTLRARETGVSGSSWRRRAGAVGWLVLATVGVWFLLDRQARASRRP